MSHYQQNPPQVIKEQYSQIYTLKSINSQDQYIEVLSGYQVNNQQPQIKSGHWSNKEHIKYIMFLQYFADLFALKHNKKLWKIFTIMSNFIKTRNSSQCRSHHQKTQRKYSSIEQILKQEKNKYRNYQLQYGKIKNILKRLPIKSPQQKVTQRISLDLPSIKVLQENVQMKFLKNIASDKQITGTRLFSQPTILGSKKLISTNYPKQSKKQKQFNSQCSISMQDQNQLLKPLSITRKNIKWGTLEPKVQIDQSANQLIDQNQLKKKNQLKKNDTYLDNKVKTKKIRSSMPIFEKESYQNNLVFQDKDINYSIQIIQANKCQTSPSRSSQQQIFQSSFQNKCNSNNGFFSGAVSSMQYQCQNFIFDQQHPNLLFPIRINNFQQNIFNNNEMESQKPMMKRRSKDESVYQHKQKVQKTQQNKKISKFVENSQKKQKPSMLRQQKLRHPSLQEYKKQQQPQIKQESFEQNTMNNYLHSYSPEMNQIYHQLYYPTIYYPPISNSQYYFYQMKNWVQFCVYFWIWKYKMNLLYMSQME